jgi:hypothetical protein
VSDAVATVRDRLLAVTAVTDLVSTRIYAGFLPQSPTLPAVLVQRVGEVQTSHLRGGQQLRVTRVQVTSVAPSRAAAVAVDEAVEGDGAGSGLSHWSGSTGSPAVTVRWTEPAGVREGYDPGELRQYRIDRDYRVHHR